MSKVTVLMPKRRLTTLWRIKDDEIKKYKETIINLENHNRELEVDVTVKERIRLKKEEKIIQGKVKEQKDQDTISPTKDE
ncbi:hypothetical protein RhiirA4_486972 [Rhizophagus irregularis]|uniref:Uncharacterized protein n=1 Tax=Rhizophagus irregularis TaxID=588596 RepID=A0A2I1HS85_9GLOM|nr:hypothetical protein RhiirA4_486972 [Rhizophagus irregularis]